MDYHKIIRELLAEKQRLDRAIRELEQFHGGPQDLSLTHRGRGRKSMGDQEREEVSRRMKRYWASRRKQQST